jgi:hypothetical protein
MPGAWPTSHRRTRWSGAWSELALASSCKTYAVPCGGWSVSLSKVGDVGDDPPALCEHRLEIRPRKVTPVPNSVRTVGHAASRYRVVGSAGLDKSPTLSIFNYKGETVLVIETIDIGGKPAFMTLEECPPASPPSHAYKLSVFRPKAGPAHTRFGGDLLCCIVLRSQDAAELKRNLTR